MTNEKLSSLINDYIGLLEHVGAESIQYSKKAMLGDYLGKASDIRNHCLWMCGEIQKFITDSEIEKAHRWLGFVQGCFWTESFCTIDELREHNINGAIDENWK